MLPAARSFTFLETRLLIRKRVVKEQIAMLARKPHYYQYRQSR